MQRLPGALGLLHRDTLGDGRLEQCLCAVDLHQLALAVAVLLGLLAHPVDHNAAELQARVDRVADLLDLGDGALGALRAEVRRGRHHDRQVSGSQGFAGERAQRRRAVDEDEIDVEVLDRSGQLGTEGPGAGPGVEPHEMGIAGDQADIAGVALPVGAGQGLGDRFLGGVCQDRGRRSANPARPQHRRGIALRVQIDDDRGQALLECGTGQPEDDGRLSDAALQAQHAHDQHGSKVWRVRFGRPSPGVGWATRSRRCPRPARCTLARRSCCKSGRARRTPRATARRPGGP